MTTTATIPQIGGSATYFIGSDAYHEIIIGVERNGRIIKTYSAEAILKSAGLSLEEWNKLSDNDKQFETHKAIILIRDSYAEHASGYATPSEAFLLANSWMKSGTHEFSARVHNGEIFFLLKGEKYGSLVIGSQYSYRDPHF